MSKRINICVVILPDHNVMMLIMSIALVLFVQHSLFTLAALVGLCVGNIISEAVSNYYKRPVI